MAMWKSLRYKKEPMATVTPGDMVNTFNTPFEIKKSECVSCLNVSNRQYPALSVRPGSTAMYSTAAAPLTTVNAAGIRAGTTFHVQDGTTWKYWNGSAFANIATGLTNASGKIFEFNTETDRYTILVNGTDKKYSTNGTSAVDLTDGPATSLYCVDDQRLFALLGTTLSSSADRSVTDWTTIDDAYEIAIVGMQGPGTAITAYNDMVIAWSDQTMHVLYGNDPLEFQLIDPIDVGCVSNKSVVQLNGALYFMDYNRIMAFTGGMPVEVGQKVKTYLDNINYTYKANIVANKWNKYAYWSIPYGTAQTTNNITLEYDTELKTFAVWNVGFAEFVNIGQDLYGITVAGVVRKLNQGTADDATAITWEWTSGVWDGTPIKQHKVLSDIWAVVDLPVSSTLNVSYSTDVDGTSFTSLYDFTANANEQNTRVQVPTTALQNVPWYRLKLSGTGPATIHYLETHGRVKVR